MNKRMNKLKIFRESAVITQEEIARLLGISKSSYCMKENGKRAFTVDEALLVAGILKKSVEKIFAHE